MHRCLIGDEARNTQIVDEGGLTAADRRAAVDRLAEARAGDGILVIGTTPFIGEGFDAPVLDTLFLAGPISFDGLLVQCAGRVIRAAPGKDLAEVHDYHDPATPILAVSLQRLTMDVLRHQAASYRRAPNTVPEVLVLLQRIGVPRFAAEVRRHLGPPAW